MLDLVRNPEDRFSHEEAQFQNDPLLCDLPSEITLEEINSQIALEYGQAMVVNVKRADDVVLRKIVLVFTIVNMSCKDGLCYRNDPKFSDR